MNRRSFILTALSAYLSLSTRTTVAKKSPLHKTAYITDPIFLQHHITPGHPESPDRMRFIKQSMMPSALWDDLIQLDLKPEIGNWLTTVHTDFHITAIRKHTPSAHRVATAGVRASLAAVDAIATGKVTNAFCATRPPGHHALNTGQEEGFCYYNNIAIAARYAQQHYGFEKILIIDWDYHHGNATEAMFYDDPSVLFFSTHDQFAYPGTGLPSRRGAGAGLGYNINVHLPCGTTDQMILEVFNTVLTPKVAEFKPALILISAGFDSRREDLLGCFDISDAGFMALTKIVMQLAERYAGGRLLSILEGGYNLTGNAKAVRAHVATLAGKTL